MPLGESGLHKRWGERGAPLLKRRYSTAIGSSITWKWLQICTDMLLIITSASDVLLRNVNVDDFEWPRTPN